ncbi:MAG: DbpA RNA binding domain-containing protein [Sandaracinaceae bacterium]|nr:DbpA RNA binding domain-containing protein [Sandaracinaceae bacterium]
MSWGEEKGADVRRLLAILCRKGDVTSQDIGEIRVQARSSAVDVHASVAEQFERNATRAGSTRSAGRWERRRRCEGASLAASARSAEGARQGVVARPRTCCPRNRGRRAPAQRSDYRARAAQWPSRAALRSGRRSRCAGRSLALRSGRRVRATRVCEPRARTTSGAGVVGLGLSGGASRRTCSLPDPSRSRARGVRVHGVGGATPPAGRRRPRTPAWRGRRDHAATRGSGRSRRPPHVRSRS